MALRRRRRSTDSEQPEENPQVEVEGIEPPEPAREFGPWDLSEMPEDDSMERVDVGSMRLPLHGLNLRVDVSPQGQVSGIRLVTEGSEMQIAAFAAPRTSGIWEDVRQEVTSSLVSQGGKTAEGTGPWGVELLAQIPTPGRQVPGRFIGVDGPRWFLRALLMGRAARDAQSAQPFEDVIRNTVVVRGDEAMPVREQIPIVLPDEMMAQVSQQMAAQQEAQQQAQAQAQAQDQQQGQPGEAPPGGTPQGDQPGEGAPQET